MRARDDDVIKNPNQILYRDQINKVALAIREIITSIGQPEQKPEEAITIHKKLVEQYPEWIWALGYTYALTGHEKEARIIIDKILKGDVTSFEAHGLIMIYSAFAEKDEAFKWLAYEPHHAWNGWVAVQPEVKPLHGDPRFEEFVKKLNTQEE